MLANDPRVAELLLLLWDASPRDAGIPIVELPKALCDEAFLTAIVSADLVRFARRNHCHHGGGEHRKLVLETGWNIARFGEPGIKQVWEAVRDALSENVEDEVRQRIQLTTRGYNEASQLVLERDSIKLGVKSSRPSDVEHIRQWIESPQGPKKDGKKIILAILNAGGRLPVQDLKAVANWTDVLSWNSARQRLNEKMAKAGLSWKLATLDGDAILKETSSVTSDTRTPKPRSKRAQKERKKRPRNDR